MLDSASPLTTEMERVASEYIERTGSLDRPGTKELFDRHPANPILTAADWPYPVNRVFNPGATLLADGTTLLLCRIEARDGSSHLCAARSADGIGGWVIDPTPTLAPDPQHFPEESWGIEDPRITYLAEMDRYAVTYTSYYHVGPGVSLAFTRDFKSFERCGQIMPPENKDAALFPRKVGGNWALVHRPVIGTHNSHIWISYSPDMVFWGRHRIVLPARPGPWWDSARVGLACPPLETEEGWLIIFHGVKSTAAGPIYRVGLALLDLEDPQRCTARGANWVLSAEMDYEAIGDIHNVVFPGGFTLDPADGDTLRLYYGGADSCVAVATASVRELVRHVKADRLI